MRGLLRAAIAASACTVVACTAIVAGQIGEASDYPVGEAGASNPSSSTSSTTSSGAAQVDECSLLQGSYDGDPPSEPNACITCIQEGCKAEVNIACNRGAKDKKQWFGFMKRCAQNPWVAFPDPDSGAGSYGCDNYKEVDEPIALPGDSKDERASEICIHDKCLGGAEPGCKLCEVTVDQPGSTREVAYLKNDPCGSCVRKNCNPQIIACCTSNAVSNYLAFCSFTADANYRRKCGTLLDAGVVGDGGKTQLGDLYGTDDRLCAYNLHQCMLEKCGSVDECHAPE